MIQAKLPGLIKGYPEFGIDTLDPFFVENLELMLPGELKITFGPGFSRGLKNCIVDKARYVLRVAYLWNRRVVIIK